MILLGNGDGISKLISENTEGSAQAPQLPRKKDKRDFPVGIIGVWWLVVTITMFIIKEAVSVWWAGGIVCLNQEFE